MSDERDQMDTSTASEETLQPARHDLLEGPGLDWAARHFSPEDLVGDSDTEAVTELIADGSQEAGD